MAVAPWRDYGYLLHSRPFGEKGRYGEILSARYGRIGVLLHSMARRRFSHAWFAPFYPLWFCVGASGSLHVVRELEPAGSPHLLTHLRRYCGLYVNELIMKLTTREQPGSALYELYADVLQVLSVPNSDVEPALRYFETNLLRIMGYAMPLSCEAETDIPLKAQSWYRYDPLSGAHKTDRSQKNQEPWIVSGGALLSLAQISPTFLPTVHRYEVKQLMRAMMNFHLDGKVLHSVKLYRSFLKMTQQAPRSPSNERA